MSNVSELELAMKDSYVLVLNSIRPLRRDIGNDFDMGYSYCCDEVNARIDKAITMLKGENNDTGTF